jgi:hypothetical protein
MKQHPKEPVMSLLTDNQVTLPAIDTTMPAQLETATFALG